MIRRAARVDDNQKEIVDGLRKCGRDVYDLSRLGEGFPDLMVVNPTIKKMYLMEVKGAKGKLTPRQERFLAEWRGPDITIVRTIEEAIWTTQN